MKGIICYFSGSGNTKLACEYIADKIDASDFELFDIVKNEPPDLAHYDIVGFATFADFCGPPQLMLNFISRLKEYPDKAAFLFNTFGFLSGKTLPWLKSAVEAKKFNVIASHTLQTPENYPPQRKRGLAADECPTPRQLDAFNTFIADFNILLQSMLQNKPGKPLNFKNRFLDLLIPRFKRTRSKIDFGIQSVLADKCNECGVCAKGCPYNAITLNPKPVFDHEKCFGCWYCYNHCKQQAIITGKMDGNFQYPKPIHALTRKLSTVKKP